MEASARYQRERCNVRLPLPSFLPCSLETLSFVQLGAGYAASNAADATIASARKLALALATPSPNDGFVVLGGNTSTLCLMLSYAVESGIEAGDVFILASSGHEANIGPWVRVAHRKGATVVWWHPSGANGEDACPLEGLKECLAAANGRAKLVALAHVSNLLGGVADVAAISRLAHESGAVVVCDSVAYAPHRALDAPAMGADFIVWSFYKARYTSNAAFFVNLASHVSYPPSHPLIYIVADVWPPHGRAVRHPQRLGGADGEGRGPAEPLLRHRQRRRRRGRCVDLTGFPSISLSFSPTLIMYQAPLRTRPGSPAARRTRRAPRSLAPGHS